MTRGKYAVRAANRRADEEAERTTESHLRQIRELTAERAHYEATLSAERKEHAKEVRILRAQRDEALGPEIAARDHVIAELRDEIAAHKRKVEGHLKGMGDLSRELQHVYQEAGMTQQDAASRVMSIYFDRELGVKPKGAPSSALNRLSREQALTLARVRADHPGGEPVKRQYGDLLPEGAE